MNHTSSPTAEKLAACDRLLIEALSQADSMGLSLAVFHIAQARHALEPAEQNINQMDFWRTSTAPASREEKHHE